MSEQRLGILGGMGPQATQDFYQRILDRTEMCIRDRATIDLVALYLELG